MGNWIAGAEADIKARGTEGVCTGDKFGGPDCPPGSRRYALAQTFHKMARKRKATHGKHHAAAHGLMRGLGMTKD